MKNQDKNDYPALWESFITTGNKEALGMIYFGHYDLLYNLGLKFTKDVQIIEDAIQNIFGYFLKSGNKFSPVTNVRGYLIQSFRHQILLDIKRQNKIYHLNKFTRERDEWHEPEVNEIFDQEDSIRLQNKLDKCMGYLTEKQKEILYLRYQCDLSYAEISVILGIAVDSCQKQVYRSLKNIRIDLEKMAEIGHRLIMFFFRKF